MDRLRAIVECLLAAHYTPAEIVTYLESSFGLTCMEAERAVCDVAGALR